MVPVSANPAVFTALYFDADDLSESKFRIIPSSSAALLERFNRISRISVAEHSEKRQGCAGRVRERKSVIFAWSVAAAVVLSQILTNRGKALHAGCLESSFLSRTTSTSTDETSMWNNGPLRAIQRFTLRWQPLTSVVGVTPFRHLIQDCRVNCRRLLGAWASNC